MFPSLQNEVWHECLRKYKTHNFWNFYSVNQSNKWHWKNTHSGTIQERLYHPFHSTSNRLVNHNILKAMCPPTLSQQMRLLINQGGKSINDFVCRTFPLPLKSEHCCLKQCSSLPCSSICNVDCSQHSFLDQWNLNEQWRISTLRTDYANW